MIKLDIQADETAGSNPLCSTNESVRTTGPVSYRLRIAKRGLPVGLIPKSLGYFTSIGSVTS